MEEYQKYVTLFSGDKMPKVGLGTWKMDNKDTTEAVFEAINVGYRHIDCAGLYGNEVEVGMGINKAIKEGVCTREEIWVTSKLWNTNHKYEHVFEAFERTFNDLNVGYVDLYLVHFPVSLEYVDPKVQYPVGWDNDIINKKVKPSNVPLQETWSAMEKIVESGKCKNIGVSNCGCQIIQDMMKYAKIMPCVNQIEFHPYLVQQRLVKFCSSVGISVTAYSPFGGISYMDIGLCGKDEPQVMDEPVVKSIAAAHKKSVAQVILQWCAQSDPKMTVVAKSSKKDRLKENLDILSFVLSDEEMKSINALNKNRRYNDPGYYCEAFYGMYFPVFE